jgi:hypothetical protein
MLAAQRLGQLVHVAVEQAHEFHHHPRAALRVGGAPGDLRLGGRGDGGVSSAFEASGTRACTSPVAGLKTSAKAARRALHMLAVDPVTDSCMGPPLGAGAQDSLAQMPASGKFPKAFCRNARGHGWTGTTCASSWPWRGLKACRARAGLRLDPATVGRRIARLEEALGARLFTKSPQGYALTEEGAAAAAPCRGCRAGDGAAPKRCAAQPGGLDGADPDRRAGWLRQLPAAAGLAADLRRQPGAGGADRRPAARLQPVESARPTWPSPSARPRRGG